MDLHPFTEEHLQELKNTSVNFWSHHQQGRATEQWFSIKMASCLELTPILISSLFSRRLGIKQIDFSAYYEGRVVLWEIKSTQRVEGIDLVLQRGANIREVKKWIKTKMILSELVGKEIRVELLIIKCRDGFSFVKKHKLV